MSVNLKLKPFSPSQLASSFEVSVELTPEAEYARCLYKVKGPLEKIVIPVPDSTAEEPTADLWKHTCFEFFFGPTFEKPYIEWNFSFDGQWSCSYLEKYREVSTKNVFNEVRPVTRSQLVTPELLLFEATVMIPRRLFGPTTLKAHAPVILLHTDGSHSYWADNHPHVDRPDFHHRNAFTHSLD